MNGYTEGQDEKKTRFRALTERWIVPPERPWWRWLWRAVLQRWRHLLVLSLGALVFAVILLLPTPAGLSPQGQRALAVLALCALYWVSGAIPMATTGLLALALLSLTGAVPTAYAFASFGNTAVFFILGALILAGAIMRSGLSARIALAFLRRFGQRPRSLLLATLFGGALLSFVMPEHAVAALLLPIVTEVAESLNLVPRADRYGEGLFLALAWGAIIGGIATFLGGARNVLAVTMFQERYGLTIGFFEWMVAVVPIVLLLLLLAALLMAFVFGREKVTGVETARIVMEGRIARMGPFSRNELQVGVVLGGTILVWVLLNERVDLATTALLSAAILFLLRLVDWKAVEGYVNWGIILMYGGAIALGSALMETGATEWLATALLRSPQIEPEVVAFVLLLLSFVLTVLSSNAAVVAMLLPVAFSIGERFGLGPMLVLYLVTVAAGLDFCLPIGTPPNAIAFSSGYLRRRTMLRVGLVLSGITLPVLWLMARFYWPLLGL